MKIALTGASGFIGKRLIARFRAEGHELRLIGRSAQFRWDAMAGNFPMAAIEGADAVVHLAGEPVAQRWNREVKRRIKDSRVLGTNAVVESMGRLERKPEVFVCASAIGYYGDRGNELLSEDAAPGTGFLPETCVAWERSADRAAEMTRVVKVRIGIVLGNDGGALKEMLTPFRLGVGGPIGNGRQWMSWIHVDDMVDLLAFAVTQPRLRGAVNAVAPNPVRNAEFAKMLGSALHRPAIVRTPAFALQLLFGEMAQIVLGSQRVDCTAARNSGFRFRNEHLADAFRDLLGL